jgi:hypothetical protein
MKYASQKELPLYTQENSGQVIDFPESPRQILISEQEFLQLKWEVSYWKSLHKRAKERKEKLKKELQEKEGKIRDHQGRTASHPTAPSHPPACGITAPGSSKLFAYAPALSEQ